MSKFLALRFLTIAISLTVGAATVGALTAGLARADDPAETVPENAAQPLWIGVHCHLPSETLRAQLALPQQQGLVVASVVPGGPATKAGIKPHDILLAADEQPLRDVGELSKIVESSGQKAIALVMLRGGKRTTLSVTPAPRSEQRPEAVAVGGPEQEALRAWIEQLAPNNADGQVRPNRRFRLRFLHPGVILGGGDLAENFPKDLSITINREGDKPLKITVEKDGEKWQVNRDELGNLPQNLLPFVERMLGERDIPALPEGELDLPDIGLPEIDLPDVVPPQIGQPVVPPADDARQLEEQLQDLQQRLKELQEAFERKQNKPAE